MLRRVLIVFLAFCHTVFAKPLSVHVTAPSAILINAETGAVLYEKEPHLRCYPASITKIATALYVLEKRGQRLDEIVLASKHALGTVPSQAKLAPGSKHPPYRLEHGGTIIGLKAGETISLAALLHGLMLSSGNDAGNVLAEAVSGNVDRFCTEMNAFFSEHGIKETQFVNPHGLHHDRHWTTAHDMAAITRLALAHPTFREIVKTTRYFKTQTNMNPDQYFVQSNKLLKPGAHYYPKAIGVKTGYHSHAGFTFVGAATHEGRTLIAVVLKCQESADRFRDVIKLFEAAFAEKKIGRTLYAQESDVFMHKIKGATEPLKAVLKEDAVLEYFPSEEPKFRAEIEWRAKDLPRLAGECAGYLRCVDEKGNVLLEKPLFATNTISKTTWAHIISFCSTHKTICLALFLGSQVMLLLFYFLKKHQKVGE